MLPRPTTHLQQKQHILLVKGQVLVAHESHFAGGIHLFNCLAASLASSGLFELHVFTTARKSLVMHQALSHGFLGSIASLKVSAGMSSQQELLKWTSTDGTQFSVVVQPESSTADDASASQTDKPGQADAVGRSSNSSSSKHDAAAAALVEAVAAAAAQLGQQCIVLLDADRLQHEVVPDTSVYGCTTCSCAEQQQQQAQQVPFMYALAQRSKQQHREQDSTHTLASQQQQQQPGMHSSPRLLVLVQNLHHLPFGPCGCGPRTPAVLAAWQQVDGMLCVSQFVASYMQQHAMHLSPLGTTTTTINSSSSSSGCASSSRVFVVHPAALGAFGQGPFVDLGVVSAAKIWGQQDETSLPAATQQQQQQWAEHAEGSRSANRQQGGCKQQPKQQHQQQQWQWHQPPVIGMLKLSREKGSDIFFTLAAQLPDFHFLAVAADDSMQKTVQAAGLQNVQLLQPQADVEGVLARMDLALVPSVLHESFGMVVLDAMLRGIPGEHVGYADAAQLGTGTCHVARKVCKAQAGAVMLDALLQRMPGCQRSDCLTHGVWQIGGYSNIKGTLVATPAAQQHVSSLLMSQGGARGLWTGL
jgi:hypothetical protein